jgi:uncharacterized damage-inducible protein DinB
MLDRTLIELLHGTGAHVGPIECVEDLTAESAARLHPGFDHSIWQQVFHMNYWMDYEIQRIRGQRPSYPDHAVESWPSAPADEAKWKQAVDRLRDLIGQFARLAEADLATLQREVEPAEPSEKERSSSVHAVLWQMVAHNSYHTGQIVQLRRALGLWPPRGGGDTW